MTDAVDEIMAYAQIKDLSGEDGGVVAVVDPDSAGYAALPSRLRGYGDDAESAEADLRCAVEHALASDD